MRKAECCAFVQCEQLGGGKHRRGHRECAGELDITYMLSACCFMRGESVITYVSSACCFTRYSRGAGASAVDCECAGELVITFLLYAHYFILRGTQGGGHMRWRCQCAGELVYYICVILCLSNKVMLS